MPSFRRTRPDAQKKAALAFSRWFLTLRRAARVCAGGGIPNRSDVFTSDLAKEPQLRWMPAYLETQKFAQQELGYAEGAQVEQILGLRLNQALIGEMSSGKALNTAAKEIEEMFRKNGRRDRARCRRCPNNGKWGRSRFPLSCIRHPLGVHSEKQLRPHFHLDFRNKRRAVIAAALNRTFRHWSLLPAVLLFGALTLYPLLNLVRMSVSTIEFAQGTRSLDVHAERNFDTLLADACCAPAIVNTLVFVAVSVAVEMVLGLALALARRPACARQGLDAHADDPADPRAAGRDRQHVEADVQLRLRHLQPGAGRARFAAGQLARIDEPRARCP